MTQQSIGGRNAQDGISGTPSGTQGADSGQGINQGGQNQQSSQGHTDHSVASPGNRGGMQGGITNGGSVQLDPQESNRDRYGDQETGATSGEVGDGRSRQQVAVSGSQATQHSKGRDDGALPKGGRNPQSADRTDGTGEGGLTQATPVQQQQSKPRAGTGGGHGGQHSGGMGGESVGALHNVGAQSGQTGRGGLGGNNVGMQGASEGQPAVRRQSWQQHGRQRPGR